MQRIALVLAGGTGERFWPLSRGERPKQLLKLLDAERTLLEQTMERLEAIFGPPNVFIVTSRQLLDAIREELPQYGSRILAEPDRRNTAGAALWGMAVLDHLLGAPDILFATFPSDHAVVHSRGFEASVRRALKAAEKGHVLVTIGIPPTRVETGFGYIRKGRSIGDKTFEVKEFCEKPDTETAAKYKASGDYLWNAGMLFCRLETFFAEIKSCSPEHLQAYREIRIQLSKGETALAEEAFRQLPSISIDHAILEKTKNQQVVEAEFSWDDVGAWDALGRVLKNDKNGNVAVGDANIFNSKNSVIYSGNSGQSVHLLGVEDLIVVTTPDAVMVCRKDQAQEVRKLAQHDVKER